MKNLSPCRAIILMSADKAPPTKVLLTFWAW